MRAFDSDSVLYSEITIPHLVAALMNDTFSMHRVFGCLLLCAALWLGGAFASGARDAPEWKNAIEEAVRAAPDARIVILDAGSGRLIATHQIRLAARTLAAPGSAIKPLVLYGMVRAHRWDPDQRIACNRQLVVAGHRMTCAHPASPPFDARLALAWSCNSYFAGLARILEPGELGQMLRSTGLLAATGLADGEATAEYREPETTADKQLAVLGTAGIRVTPLELAAAYRWLALQLDADPSSEAAQVVRAGLEDSASFGMASQASLGRVPVLGKTGTAEDIRTAQTHGWFAGLVPTGKPQAVIVVYLPSGRGTDAAQLAGEILKRAPLERK